MMKAVFEEFKNRIWTEPPEVLRETTLSIFVEKDALQTELNKLKEVHTGMVREYQKTKEELEKSKAECKKLIKQNQHLTDVTSMRTNDLYGRGTEKTEDLLNRAVSSNATEQKDPIDEDADDGASGADEGPDVDRMAEAEVKRLLKELLGEKEEKKKEKGRRNRDISKLPKREEYLYDLQMFDELYGPGWKINRWKKMPSVERIRSSSYLQLTYTPLLETMDGRIVDPYMLEPLIPKSLISSSLMSSILYDKYKMFLPYYRQEKDPERFGFPVSRQTMCNWEIHICEELFMPVYLHLKELMKEFWYQHCDETPWMVVRDGRSPGTKGYFWVHLSGELIDGYKVLFVSFELSRAAGHLTDFYKGVDHPVNLTDDAYAGYYTAQKEFPDIITICGCLTHSRRRFVNAILVMRLPQKISANELEEIPEYRCIIMLAEIYKEDGKLKPLTAEERLEKRQETVKPLFDGFIDYIKSIDTNSPEVSDVFKDAIEYTINHEQELRQFLSDGNVPIDNSAVERQIRYLARLRVNSLFSTTKRGADASAVMMTLIQTAELNDADPYYYMKYLMDELPRHLYQDPSTYVKDMVPWSEKYRKYEISERQKMLDSIKPPDGIPKPDFRKLWGKRKRKAS